MFAFGTFGSALDQARRHFRQALRTVTQRRGSSRLAIAILALGIGVSVAMFSLVDAVLLRPLPFPNQDSIHVIWKTDPQARAPFVEMAYPELRDLRENIRAFQYVALMPTTLYGYGKVLQTGAGEPVQIESTPVSHDFFRVLGVAPALGRDFAASDEHPGAAPVAMVSDSVWRQYLGADRNIIGRTIRLNGQGATVIGVMAPGVAFPRGAGLWVPLGIDPRVITRRTATFLQAIARVAPGYPRRTLGAQVNSLFARQAADHPEAYSRSQQGVVTPLAEYWTGSARLHLWVMLTASILLLLAAMVSAGNLFLSRALSRRREIATRAALGAGFSQILAQFAAEGLAAGILAAAAGLAIADAAIRFFIRWSPGDIPRLQESALHLGSFAFAALAGLAAAVVCSILPSWLVVRANLDAALKSGGTRIAGSRAGARTQGFFVFAQAGATVMLVAMASLLVLSYRSMMAVDTGFAHRDAVTMNLALRAPGPVGSPGYDQQKRREFYSRLLERLRQSPGVTAAAAVLLRPLEGAVGWDTRYQFEFEAGRYDNREPPQANYEVVTPGYFAAVGTPVQEGRDFSIHDDEHAASVAIISGSIAKRIRAAGIDPIGSRFRFGRAAGADWVTVVGVCAPARYRSIMQAEDDIYVPDRQAGPPTNYVVIRGSRPAGELATLVRRTAAGLDGNQAVASVATLGSLIESNAARHRFNMVVLLWFGACALVLAAAAVFSVIAQSVDARRREIAIRSVLGARRPRLLRDIVARTMLWVAAGEVAGVAGAMAMGKLASELLYGVSPGNPLAPISAAAFLILIAITAAAGPAWSAAGEESAAIFRGE